MIVLSAFFMTCWTGCKFFNPPSDQSKSAHSPKSAKIQYAFSANEEMVDLFYIKIDYLDEEGQTKTVTLNEPTWALTVQSKELPAKFGMKINITLRGMADPGKYEVLPVNFGWSYTTTALDEEGNAIGDYHRNSANVETDLPRGKVSLWVEEYAKDPIGFTVEYDAKGELK